MRLLLDTQVGLWWLVGSPRLTRASRALISSSACNVSVASIWEIAIKHRIGKMPVPPREFRDAVVDAGMSLLPVGDLHATTTTEIPNGHNDPFDRLLLATAEVERLILVTGDETLFKFANQ